MDRTPDLNAGMDRESRTDADLRNDEVDEAPRHDWDRHQWVGEGQGDTGPSVADETNAGSHRRWEGGEWVGEGQGGDMSRPDDPTIEGDTELSGHGHAPEQAHWGRSSEDDRMQDR